MQMQKKIMILLLLLFIVCKNGLKVNLKKIYKQTLGHCACGSGSVRVHVCACCPRARLLIAWFGCTSDFAWYCCCWVFLFFFLMASLLWLWLWLWLPDECFYCFFSF